MAAMALLEGETEAITRKAVELAKAGDTVALRLVLERLLPKSRAVRIDLPMRTLEDLDQAGETVREALAEGAVTLDEVRSLAGLLEARRRLIETTELERRLAALEAGRAGAMSVHSTGASSAWSGRAAARSGCGWWSGGRASPSRRPSPASCW